MIKHSKKIIMGTALALMISAGSMAYADTRDYTDHEFVTLDTTGLTDKERLELNRYLNYEHDHSCENYRKPPSPFIRKGCDIVRGERLDYTLYFDTDSDSIKEHHKIGKIAKAIKRYNPEDVVIVGHTDTDGSYAYNEALAERRVEAVAKALKAKGISEDLFDKDAEGEDELAIQTNDEVSNQKNRRVTVLLMR